MTSPGPRSSLWLVLAPALSDFLTLFGRELPEFFPEFLALFRCQLFEAPEILPDAGLLCRWQAAKLLVTTPNFAFLLGIERFPAREPMLRLLALLSCHVHPAFGTASQPLLPG